MQSLYLYMRLACENSHFSSLLAARDLSLLGTSTPQWQKFHTDDVKFVRSLVRSSDWLMLYIVLAIVYERQIKDKRPQSSNVNATNLLPNSQYSWNLFIFRRSIWVLLELLCKRTQNFTIIRSTGETKLNKFTFGTPWLSD